MSKSAKQALEELNRLSRFPKGESVDVPKYLKEHGNPEAAEAWVEMNEEYGDLLKKASPASKQANQIAKTIIEQMGGAGRLRMFLGVKRIVARPKGIWFQWPAKKPSKTGNTLEVTLNGRDLYDLEFSYTTASKGSRKIKEFRNVYFDQLVEIFEKHTGWYLRLGSQEENTMTAYDELKELTAGWEPGHRVKEKLPEGPGSLLPGMEIEIKTAKTVGDVRDIVASRFPPQAENFNKIKDPDGFWEWDVNEAAKMSGIKRLTGFGDIGDMIFWLNMAAASWERILKSNKNRKKAGATLSKMQVQKLLKQHKIPGKLSGSGRNWEVELPDEKMEKKFMKVYPSEIHGYKTGYGAWVMKPGKNSHPDNADYNDPSSRHHYALQEDEMAARFEEGEPADPTVNMSPEDKEKWKKQKELNKDKFKEAKSQSAYNNLDMVKVYNLIDSVVKFRKDLEVLNDLYREKTGKALKHGDKMKKWFDALDTKHKKVLLSLIEDSQKESGTKLAFHTAMDDLEHEIRMDQDIEKLGGLWDRTPMDERRSDDGLESKFEEGESADPTENMNEEDAKKWRLQNLKNRDNFTDKKAENLSGDIDTAFKQLAEALKSTGLPTFDGKYRTRVEPSEFMLEDSDEENWKFKHQISRNFLLVGKEMGQITIPTGEGESYGGVFNKQATNISPYHDLDNKETMTLLAKALKMKLSPYPLAVPGDTSWMMESRDLDVHTTFSRNGKVALYIFPSIDIDDSQEPLFEKEGMVIRDLKQLTGLATRAASQVLRSPILKHLKIERMASQNASGLYGYTRKIQGDCEACIRKTTRTASKLAKMAWHKDNDVSAFLSAHAKRADSLPAKILVEAMKGVGPKVASKGVEGRRNGLYGFRPKTASLGMKMCNSLRVEIGHYASDLHKRRSDNHSNITGFLKQHSKEAKCMYSRMLHASYPEAQVSKKASQPNSVLDWLKFEV